CWRCAKGNFHQVRDTTHFQGWIHHFSASDAPKMRTKARRVTWEKKWNIAEAAKCLHGHSAGSKMRVVGGY
ncbi:MAG: hypothetical protein ACRD22_22910, partial [Terriglobia bacterium]